MKRIKQKMGKYEINFSDEERLKRLKEAAEKAYDRIYDTVSSTEGAASYSDAKEALYDAIALARKMGNNVEVAALEKRLQYIKAVYRKQFSE